jgi:hypothetical protein
MPFTSSLRRATAVSSLHLGELDLLLGERRVLDEIGEDLEPKLQVRGTA